MPELPEVEVVRQGLMPHLSQQKIVDVVVRCQRLRFDIPANLTKQLTGQVIQAISRRGKYLLFSFDNGTLLCHLGMSGSLRLLTEDHPPKKHDHVDLIFKSYWLRLNDPRRFGMLLWIKNNPLTHPLLKDLGPEPLSKDFTTTYLVSQASKRTLPIKAFLMNSKVVVGVGNIYATEVLFATGIHPLTPANQLKPQQLQAICQQTKQILRKAIQRGGTTLKDFVNSKGKPGYFKQRLKAYGRAGHPCVDCGTLLEQLRLAQRASTFCPLCQPITKQIKTE